MALIAPSLLGADLTRLGEVLHQWEEQGVRMVHVDVTDGHCVPDITVGQPVIQNLRKATDLVLDIHLLVERPERYALQFVECGADRVAIPAESTPNLHQALSEIRSHGVLAGLAVNPSTAIDSVKEAVEDADYLLILTADPGLKSAAFIPRTVQKVVAAAALCRERGLGFEIEVEGGIGLDQVEKLREAGADILVADSDIFGNDVPRNRLGDMIRLAGLAEKSSSGLQRKT